MALSPQGAKAKGAGGELEAARLLTLWAVEVGVSLDPTRNLEQSRAGGFDLNGVPGLGVEVKRQESLDLTSWWRQTLRQAEAGGVVPLLMYRQNRKAWRFKVRQYVAIYGAHKAGTVLMDFEMDEAAAKAWFQQWLLIRLAKPPAEAL